MSADQSNLILDSGAYALVILLILFVMSFFAWGVTLLKWKEFKLIKKNNKLCKSSIDRIQNFRELGSIYSQLPDSPVKNIVTEVLSEVKKLSPYVSYDNIPHRSGLIEQAVERAVEANQSNENKYIPFLAVVSSLSPFLGLLGTVWGIMSSFFEIGAQGSAELSVVAPGIAGALITTVGGLIVAIPASAAFNLFTGQGNSRETEYYNFGSSLISLFKRNDMSFLEEELKK
jgi:biopolymer transport protein TolQ